MTQPINKQPAKENIEAKAIKELELVTKDKKNKKILESFKEQLLRNKLVTA